MGIQPHGLAHDVGRLGPALGEKAHVVHGVKQLPVGGLEAVYLRNGPGQDHAHGVGHEVDLQGLGDGLLHHLFPQPHHIGVRRPVLLLFGGLFLGHWYHSLSAW